MTTELSVLKRGRVLIGAIALLTVLVAVNITADLAGASNQIASSAKRNSATIDTAPLKQAGSADTPATRSVSPRSAKRWRFFMPISTAENRSLNFARYMYDNSAPDEYSSEIYSPSYWDEYDSGLCKRQGYSKVKCFNYIAAEFEIVNGSGQVIGYDEFSCAWYTDVWYPVGTKRFLKWNTYQFTCFWESD